ncbi:hypothetical protein ACFY0B_09130 [Streptomyces sp. NPDC001797]|uniref:hypothetical protein n=1 Tax=Streptomyces sp. NPDC001797 TaxID=3364610 RepID=UPI0036BC6C10
MEVLGPDTEPGRPGLQVRQLEIQVRPAGVRPVGAAARQDGHHPGAGRQDLPCVRVREGAGDAPRGRLLHVLRATLQGDRLAAYEVVADPVRPRGWSRRCSACRRLANPSVP